jgi:hypothetical protein
MIHVATYVKSWGGPLPLGRMHVQHTVDVAAVAWIAAMIPKSVSIPGAGKSERQRNVDADGDASSDGH